MGSLRQIRENRVRPLRVIPESDFELNPDWQVPSASGSSAEEPNENELAGHHRDYQNPDTLFMKSGSVAFIYTTQGRMYYGDENTTHYEIIGEHPELVISRYRLYGYYQEHGIPMTEGAATDLSNLVDAKKDKAAVEPSALSSSADPNKRKCGYCKNYIPKDATVCPDCDEDPNYVDPYGSAYQSDPSSYVSSSPSGPRRINSDGDEMEPREVATEMGDLLGRLGRQGMLVSFWNDKPEQYTEHLKPCLEKLVADGHLKPAAQVSTPTHGTISMQEALGGAQGRALTPEEQERLELHKQLHLMRGKEKQDAMKKLGVGGGGKPHPMQAAMDQAGLRVPGQKWWAPHSESFDRRLAGVLKKLGVVVKNPL